MTYAELNTTISTSVIATGLDFLHSEQDHINTYTGNFPLAVLDPPTANFPTSIFPFTPSYDIRMAFMGLLENDTDWSVRRGVVETQYNYAAEFVMRLNNSTDVEAITNVVIQPFFTFTFSSHLTAGVLLSFEIETVDDFDYCGDSASITYGIGTFIVS